MILLTGATGTVGRSLLRELAGRDDVRALARTDASAKVLDDAGVPVVRGDLTDRSALTAALAGVDRLFLLTPPGPAQPRTEVAVLEAAAAAGVRRVVYQSLYDPGSGTTTLREWHEPAERWLEGSGLSWAALRPPVFSDNLVGSLETIRRGTIVWPDSTGALSHVDSRDVAAVARHALDDPSIEGHVALTGPEALTYPQVARRLSEHLGFAVEHLDVPPAAFRAGVVAAGVDPVYADALVAGAAFYAAQEPYVETAAIRAATGSPARPVDDVIRDRIVPAIRA